MHRPGGREQATTLNNISSVMLDLVTHKRHAWTWWTRASCAPPRRAGSMSPSARQTHQPHPDMKFRHICVNRLMQAREPSCGRASRLAGERTALWARRRSVLGWHAAERKGGRNVGAGKQRNGGKEECVGLVSSGHETAKDAAGDNRLTCTTWASAACSSTQSRFSYRAVSSVLFNYRHAPPIQLVSCVWL